MEGDATTVEGTETPTTAAGDTDGEPEKKEGEADKVNGESVKVEGEPENVEGEQGLPDHSEISGEGTEYMQGEHVEGEYFEYKHTVLGEGEELMGEAMQGEYSEQQEEEEVLEEEAQYLEDPPPDPAAPLNLSDYEEASREPFELRNDQLVEVELLWELYQNCTPAYADLDNFITEKELVYMLKALLLMTYTPEQLVELVEFCVRPPHPDGHINYEQFLKMVTIRQRDFVIEEELRSALQVFDPDNTGVVDREYLKETLLKDGYKMNPKQLDNLIKEVDIANDGTIGIEDVVGTMCIDLNKEDLQLLRETLNPKPVAPTAEGEEEI